MRNLGDKELEKKDELMLVFLQKDFLNELWYREPGAVSVNLSSLQMMYRYTIGGCIFYKPLPRIGPIPLSYLLGMNTEVLLLQQSLNSGRYRECLQWDSSRSYSAAYGNICILGVNSLGVTTLTVRDKNMMITTSPTR